jgi:hypothetical protein
MPLLMPAPLSWVALHGPCVLGFACARAGALSRQVGSDRRRDVRLAQLGLRVLRLEAQLVLRDIEAAVERVRAALG